MTRLSENQRVGNYLVIYFIKETLYCSSYRVMDDDGKSFFMKVFDIASMPEGLLVDGVPQEIHTCKVLNHEIIISYIDSGRFLSEERSYYYLVTEFFVGELLSDALVFNGLLTFEDRIRIARGIAEGLKYMSDEIGFAHNDICPRNIVLVSDSKAVQLMPRIIDLGHAAKPFIGAPLFPEDDLNIEFRAPETFSGEYSCKSDVFSFSVLLYELLFDRLPWEISFEEDLTPQDRITILFDQRSYPVNIPSCHSSLDSLLSKGLSPDPDKRPTYDEILSILTEDNRLLKEISSQEGEKINSFRKSPQSDSTIRKTHGGFDDVAGMDSLKKELKDKVIWVLRNKEKAALYRITPPNGMLLYGPPGCGKTFFAQKFAEESGFYYQLINGSDLGSTFVHGSQIKIGELFQEAEKNAPTVLCFDEFDAFVPVRGAVGTEYAAEEVNEFLAQLNNCAQRGIFVIGTTNRKDMIDPAVLRKGRMDLHFYIPAPDTETRKLMFQKHLSNRPLSEDINYNLLAENTDNYAASDIAFIVNEAALVAALADELISQRHLESAIIANKSSIYPENTRRRIGF